MMNRRFLLLGFFLFGLSLALLPAMAQQADDNVIRMQGVFQKVDGQVLTIRGADGNPVTLQTTAQTMFTRNEPATLASIKPGDFVASAAMRGDDGKLHSLEVRIFPPELNGAGEGQRPMKDTTKTMTNATVSEVVAAPEGQTLKVKFQGNTSELIVGPDVPVIRVVIGTVGDLKVGANVFVSALKGADGTLSATRVLAQ